MPDRTDPFPRRALAVALVVMVLVASLALLAPGPLRGDCLPTWAAATGAPERALAPASSRR